MRKPSPALVVACVALFVALGGPATAAKLISGKKIKPNSITTTQIRNRTLTSDDISRSTLSSLKATAREVTSEDIVDGSVELADMAANSVTGNQVVDRSLAAVDITADSLTGGELATGAVGADELLPDSVVNAKIKDSVVTKTKLASEAVASSEVRDGSLTTKDVGQLWGTLAPPSTVGQKACVQQPAVPTTGALPTHIVLVGAPGPGLLASVTPTDGNLTLQVCNLTDTPVNLNTPLPYVAFAT